VEEHETISDLLSQVREGLSLKIEGKAAKEEGSALIRGGSFSGEQEK
jgi:hypothetical protein